jgi:hypothetical protein
MPYVDLTEFSDEGLLILKTYIENELDTPGGTAT